MVSVYGVNVYATRHSYGEPAFKSFAWHYGDGPKRGKQARVEQMAWDDRGYYYRSVKRQGRVTREYFGKGPLAELVAQMDAIERQDRTSKRMAANEDRERLRELDSNLDRLDAVADALVVAVLEQSGFHRHKGEWRKRRDQIPVSECQDASPDLSR